MSDLEVFNTSQAAAFLGVHEQTIRKLSRKSQIPCFKVGTDWRFRKEALVRWADEQQQVNNPAETCSVLIIDDEEKVCTMLAKMVKRFGCRARQTTDAALGLELVAQDVPDVILLDLMMPRMNGPQFLKQLRRTYPHLPVVIVTGYPDSKLMKQAAQFAPVMLLDKPVDPQSLERTVLAVAGKNSVRTT